MRRCARNGSPSRRKTSKSRPSRKPWPAPRRENDHFTTRIPDLHRSFIAKAEERAEQNIAELRRRYDERHNQLRDQAEQREEEALEAAFQILVHSNAKRSRASFVSSPLRFAARAEDSDDRPHAMSNAATQAYLNTRVSVMTTRLFTPELIERLSRMTLVELAEHFGLPALLDEQPATAARSRAIEQSLLQVLLAELQVLARPMNAAERALVLAWGRKYALFNLKTLLRGKLHDLDQKEIHDYLFDLPETIRLSHQELFRAENVLELLRQLETGPHRQIARQAREVYEKHHEPFALEAAVDRHYYTGLVRQIMGSDNHHLNSLRRLMGTELDRVALLWLLRFRFSYQLSPSETYYQLVPSTRLLTRDRLLYLVNLDTLERVLEALPAPLDTVLADCRTIGEVQQRIGRYTRREMRGMLSRSQSAVARALAYLMLRETDLLQLFAVMRGRLLRFPDIDHQGRARTDRSGL